MSIQAYNIFGVGYKLKSDEISELKFLNQDFCHDDLKELLYDLDLIPSYYYWRDMAKYMPLSQQLKEAPIKIIDDPMGGDDCFIVMRVVSVSYLENTHGDDDWQLNFESPAGSQIEYIQSTLEKIIGKQEKEPEFITYQRYS